MEYLTNRNCKRLTDHSLNDILSLTGIFGIHTREELTSDAVIYSHKDIDDDTITVEFETTLLKEFVIRIDLRNKTIKDDKMVSSELKKGLSFPWLESQIENAVRLGYKKISIQAYGGKEKDVNYIGHLIWGKYGFEMSSEKDKKKFVSLMRKNKLGVKSLFDLQQTAKGQEFWADNGWSWIGEFHLSENSQTMKNFNLVRDQRKTKKL